MRNPITKVTVNMSTEAVDALREHAVAHGITMTESLRRAMGLQQFLDRETSKGAKVLIGSKRGDYRQVMM